MIPVDIDNFDIKGLILDRVPIDKCLHHLVSKALRNSSFANMKILLSDILPTCEFGDEITFTADEIDVMEIATIFHDNDETSPRRNFYLISEFQYEYMEIVNDYGNHNAHGVDYDHKYRAGIDFTKFFPERTSHEWSEINKLIFTKRSNRSKIQVLNELRDDSKKRRLYNIANVHKSILSDVLPVFYDEPKRELEYLASQKEALHNYYESALQEEQLLEEQLDIEITKIAKFE